MTESGPNLEEYHGKTIDIQNVFKNEKDNITSQDLLEFKSEKNPDYHNTEKFFDESDPLTQTWARIHETDFPAGKEKEVSAIVLNTAADKVKKKHPDMSADQIKSFMGEIVDAQMEAIRNLKQSSELPEPELDFQREKSFGKSGGSLQERIRDAQKTSV